MAGEASIMYRQMAVPLGEARHHSKETPFRYAPKLSIGGGHSSPLVYPRRIRQDRCVLSSPLSAAPRHCPSPSYPGWAAQMSTPRDRVTESRTPFATALQPTYSKTGPTSASFGFFSGIAIWQTPPSTCMFCNVISALPPSSILSARTRRASACTSRRARRRAQFGIAKRLQAYLSRCCARMCSMKSFSSGRS